MTNKPEYKTDRENYLELLEQARKMSTKEIQIALRQRNAFHVWAVNAYEQALKERKEKHELDRARKNLS